jgi:hypothetical protein
VPGSIRLSRPGCKRFARRESRFTSQDARAARLKCSGPFDAGCGQGDRAPTSAVSQRQVEDTSCRHAAVRVAASSSLCEFVRIRSLRAHASVRTCSTFVNTGRVRLHVRTNVKSLRGTSRHELGERSVDQCPDPGSRSGATSSSRRLTTRRSGLPLPSERICLALWVKARRQWRPHLYARLWF